MAVEFLGKQQSEPKIIIFGQNDLLITVLNTYSLLHLVHSGTVKILTAWVCSLWVAFPSSPLFQHIFEIEIVISMMH